MDLQPMCPIQVHMDLQPICPTQGHTGLLGPYIPKPISLDTKALLTNQQLVLVLPQQWLNRQSTITQCIRLRNMEGNYRLDN